MRDQCLTPLADAVRASESRESSNFHALPWRGDCPVDDEGLLRAYAEIFGTQLPRHDISHGSDVLDSIFRPHGALLDAQLLAARAFGADRTHFLSCGSTMGNTIAISAVAFDRSRLLIDPAAHQSVHFAADHLGAEVLPFPGKPGSACDLAAITERLRAAVSSGRRFSAVVLTASTYDGERLTIEPIIRELTLASPGTVLVIDDAWAAVHTFSPLTDEHSPVRAGRGLLDAGLDVRMIVVHSAHKTMRAMRPATYLHVLGADPHLHDRVQESLFRHHTTSPSWPVLASLDLARAHGVAQGAALVQRSVDLSDRLAEMLAAQSGHGFAVVPPTLTSDHHVADPMKIRVRVPTELDPTKVRRALWTTHGIHIPRVVGDDLLLSVTIGIGEQAIADLAHALITSRWVHSAVSAPEKTRRSNTTDRLPDAPDGFVIAYPPGVPMAAPYLADGRANRAPDAPYEGAELFSVTSMASQRRRKSD